MSNDENNNKIIQSEEDARVFSDAIANPAEPNEKLKSAAGKYLSEALNESKNDDGSQDECSKSMLQSDKEWEGNFKANGGDIQSLEKDWEDLSRRETGSDLQEKNFQDEFGKEVNSASQIEDGAMKMKSFDQGEFERIGEEGIAFLNEHFHPHAKMIITTTGVEIVEGSHSHTTHKYNKD